MKTQVVVQPLLIDACRSLSASLETGRQIHACTQRQPRFSQLTNMPGYLPVESEETPSGALSPASLDSRYDPYDTQSTPVKGDAMGSTEGKAIHSFPPRSAIPPRNRGMRTALDILKSLIVPLVAIGYLAFCYVVHKRIVPLKTSFLDLTQYRLCKSGCS